MSEPEVFIEPVLERPCSKCGTVMPVKDFPTGQMQCRECLRRQVIAKETRKKNESTEIAIKNFISQMKGNAIPCPHIKEATAVVMDEFGGWEQFFREWVELIKARIEAADGVPDKLVLDAFRTWGFSMVNAAGQQADTSPDAASLSDSELRAAILEFLPRLFDPKQIENAIKSA